MISIDVISTAVSAIIIAVSIVGPVITKTISNIRGNKPSNTVLLMMTYAIRAVIGVDALEKKSLLFSDPTKVAQAGFGPVGYTESNCLNQAKVF